MRGVIADTGSHELIKSLIAKGLYDLAILAEAVDMLGIAEAFTDEEMARDDGSSVESSLQNPAWVIDKLGKSSFMAPGRKH